jgi:hypothetical protein
MGQPLKMEIEMVIALNSLFKGCPLSLLQYDSTGVKTSIPPETCIYKSSQSREFMYFKDY